MTCEGSRASELIGPYRVLEAIGAGGSARVDLARVDRAYGFQRHVVLKRPLEHLRGDPKAAAALQREARIGGRLQHPNLVAVLDAGVHDGYDYLVLEYVHGASLRTLMESDEAGRVRELPIAVALAIVADIARGLHHAHELPDESGGPLGLVHRDVAPGNVLIGHDGTVKLADFGIAKETRVHTLSGSLHGTVTYMAPELCRGHAFDRRADVFSLGVILYELVTGTRLFWADNDVAALHRVLSGAVPRPREVAPSIDAALEAIVLRALAADPAARFATALDLAVAVERWAATANELLTARAIARWVQSVLGARDVPWLGAATIPEAPRGERSLVELIAATGDDDQPVGESFGPDVMPQAEQPAPAPPRRRLAVASMIGGGVFAGALAVVALLADAEAPASVTPPTITVPSPTSSSTTTVTGAVDDEASVVRAATPAADTPPDHGSSRVETGVPRVRRPRDQSRGARPSIRASKPRPTDTRAATGSGSSARPESKPSAKWDPTLLLPTDPQPPKR